MCVHKLEYPSNLDLEEIDDNCEYEKAGNSLDCDYEDLNILQLNIRGLNSKTSDLNQLMSTTFRPNFPELILLSETWLKQHSPLLTFAGYKLERYDRTTKRRGGVRILILERCNYTRRHDLECYSDSFESCFIELQTTKTKLIIGSIYRLPNTDVDEFMQTFRHVTEIIKKQTLSRHLIIGLDHNLDLLKSSSHKPTQQFLEMLYKLRMLPTDNY